MREWFVGGRVLIATVALLAAWLGAVGEGQAQDLRIANRGPRFLYAASPTGTPVEVDVTATKILRQRVTLPQAGQTVEALLNAIAKQTGLRFVYSRALVGAGRRVQLQAKSITLAAALTEILVDTGVDVLLSEGGQVVLVQRGKRVAAAGTIVGRVTDAKTSDALAGAEVYLEGTRWRASTSGDGRYRLVEVEPGTYTLAVRRVGYGKQSRAVVIAEGREVTVDVALQPVATQLNEIVTTVTGEQRRVELGHVVGRINADSVAREAPVSSLSELLSGRVPGLQVAQTQGTVGGQAIVRVRGPNSVSLNNEPIVIVDGVRYTTEARRRVGTLPSGPGTVEPSSPLNDLNVNDIESIEVVKGPSAATLYGTDAAGGVLVITTKRGRPGPARWNAYAKGTTTAIPSRRFPELYWGWGTVLGVPNNPTASCTLARLANGQCTRQDSVTVLTNPLDDPQFTIFGNKPRWEYGANVSGGRQDLRYYFSGDFEDATGPIRMPPAAAEQLRQQHGTELPEEWREPNAQTKLNLRNSLTAVLGQQAELRLNTGYVRSATRALALGSNPYTATYNIPTPSSPYGTGVQSRFGPAQAFARTTSERIDRFLGSAGGDWRPGRWLAMRATVGLDLANSDRYALVRPGDQPGNSATRNGVVEDARTRYVTTTADLGATATARRGRLSARTAIGAQYTRSLTSGSGVVGTGLPPGGVIPERATTVQTAQQYAETVVLGGYLEEMLGLNERLFLTGALRLDGASTFGRDYEAAVYPKVGASWLLSEEPFLPRLPGLEELRLRYAFGTAGRQPAPWMALPAFATPQMQLNGRPVPTVFAFTIGNPDLEPERVREHEFGFDATALSNRLAFDVTWFRRRTSGMIISQDGPPGRGPLPVNLGLVTQRGFEAQVQARVLNTRWLSWDLRLQHADYTTKLVDVGGALMERSVSGGYVEGYPLGARFQNPIIGWADANGDGILAGGELQFGDTAVYLGNSLPPRVQTLTSVVGLFQRKLRLSALLERKSGFTQVDGLRCRGGLTCREAVDPSTPLADQVKGVLPGLYPQSADFTRLREVTAALDLPTTLAHALRVRSASLVASARNLALWTDFSGADPEVGDPGTFTTSNLVGQNYAATGMPLGRVFSLRLDLGF